MGFRRLDAVRRVRNDVAHGYTVNQRELADAPATIREAERGFRRRSW